MQANSNILDSPIHQKNICEQKICCSLISVCEFWHRHTAWLAQTLAPSLPGSNWEITGITITSSTNSNILLCSQKEGMKNDHLHVHNIPRILHPATSLISSIDLFSWDQQSLSTTHKVSSVSQNPFSHSKQKDRRSLKMTKILNIHLAGRKYSNLLPFLHLLSRSQKWSCRGKVFVQCWGMKIFCGETVFSQC